VAKFSRKKTKIQKMLNTGLLTSFETNCTICNAHSFLQKNKQFLAYSNQQNRRHPCRQIPSSKKGGTLVPNFNKQNKTASFQLHKAKHLHLPCQFQQANRHGTKVCLELTVRRVSLAASVASETLTPAAVAVSFAASAACPVWYWIFSPTSPANHPTNQKKEKKHPKFSNAPFSLLAELDHDS
jgi:hypothetical protein